MLKKIIQIVKWLLQFCITADLEPKKKQPKRKRRRTGKRRLVVRSPEAIDGDTIRGVVRGENVKIRLILVDTPETKHPRLGKQPFGEEASKFVAHRLSIAKRVEVELHGNGSTDKYGRLVGHVFVSGQNLNRLLLKNGYARLAYRYRKYAYEDVYEMAEEHAKAKRLRIWSVKGYVQDHGFEPAVIKKNQIS